MKFEAIFLATDKYSIESILNEEQFFENYLLNLYLNYYLKQLITNNKQPKTKLKKG